MPNLLASRGEDRCKMPEGNELISTLFFPFLVLQKGIAVDTAIREQQC